MGGCPALADDCFRTPILHATDAGRSRFANGGITSRLNPYAILRRRKSLCRRRGFLYRGQPVRRCRSPHPSGGGGVLSTFEPKVRRRTVGKSTPAESPHRNSYSRTPVPPATRDGVGSRPWRRLATLINTPPGTIYTRKRTDALTQTSRVDPRRSNGKKGNNRQWRVSWLASHFTLGVFQTPCKSRNGWSLICPNKLYKQWLSHDLNTAP